jgi:glycine amidinotransferase
MNSPVSSFNEWDPLEEIVVGSVQGAIYPDYGPIAAAIGDPRWLIAYQGAFVEQELIDEAEEQLAGLVAALEAAGVTVRRPDPIPHNAPFSTPLWSVRGGWNAANARDLFLVVGDQIVECATPQRHRHFERLAYRRILDGYFRRGARWISAPPPALTESLYDWGALDREPPAADEHGAGLLAAGQKPHYPITESEPVWEAADFVRCGRDLYAIRSMVTNAAGIEWVRRHLGGEYRIHELETRCPNPCHIDTTFVPLAPGKALVHPAWLGQLPESLRHWDLITAPAPEYRADSPMQTPYFSSQWLSMNVLSLDEKRVFVDAQQLALIRLLESHGFEPIPLEFDALGAFGGSFHCVTLDVRRRGELAEY